MMEDKILKKIRGKKYPISKYRDERKIIKDKISAILETKVLPKTPITSNRNLSVEDIVLEKKLGGKHFWELSEDEQSLLLGDLFFLTKKAFNYYIFEIIFVLLSQEENFHNNIVIQQLFFNTMSQSRLKEFKSVEIQVIIDLLFNIANEIEEVVGEKELYNKLEEWERAEVYHPFIEWEEEIKKSILNWKNYLSLSEKKVPIRTKKESELRESLSSISRQYNKLNKEVYNITLEKNILNFFSEKEELQQIGLNGIRQLLSIRLWEEVFGLSNMNPKYSNYYQDIFIDDFKNFDEWYEFIKDIVLKAENYYLQ
jgi:hypothetical protein